MNAKILQRRKKSFFPFAVSLFFVQKNLSEKMLNEKEIKIDEFFNFLWVQLENLFWKTLVENQIIFYKFKGFPTNHVTKF